MFTTDSNIALNPTPKYGKIQRRCQPKGVCNNWEVCTVNLNSPYIPVFMICRNLTYGFINNYEIKKTDENLKSAKFPYDFSKILNKKKICLNKFFLLESDKDIVNTNKLPNENYIGVISNDHNKPDELQKIIEKIVPKFIAENATEKNYYLCTPRHVMGIKLRKTVEDMVVLYFYDPNDTYKTKEYIVHNPNNALAENIQPLGQGFFCSANSKEKKYRYPKTHDIFFPRHIKADFQDGNGLFILCSDDRVEIANADAIIIDESDQAAADRINLIFMKLLSGLPLSEKDKDFFNNNATKIADLNKTYALGFNLVELLSMLKQDKSLKKFVFNILNHENLSSKEKVNIINTENSTLMSSLLKFNRIDDLSFFIDTILESNLDYNDKIELLKVTPKKLRKKFSLKINTSYFPYFNILAVSSSVLSSLASKLVYVKQILMTSKLSLVARIKLLIPENILSFLLSIPVYIVVGILECPFFLLKAILSFLNKFIKADENTIKIINYILYMVLFPYLFVISITICLIFNLILTTDFF
jgi:hypothetical protein